MTLDGQPAQFSQVKVFKFEKPNQDVIIVKQFVRDLRNKVRISNSCKRGL